MNEIQALEKEVATLEKKVMYAETFDKKKALRAELEIKFHQLQALQYQLSKA